MLTIDDYNAFCKSLPATHYVVQWGGSHVWKVGGPKGKVFAIANHHSVHTNEDQTGDVTIVLVHDKARQAEDVVVRSERTGVLTKACLYRLVM